MNLENFKPITSSWVRYICLVLNFLVFLSSFVQSCTLYIYLKVSTAQATNFVEQNFSPTFGTVPFPFYQQTSIFPQISSGTFPKINNNSDHCYYQFYDSNNSMSSPYILNHSRSNSAGAGKKRVGGRRPKIENVRNFHEIPIFSLKFREFSNFFILIFV